MTPDKELQYQARIRELIEACNEEHCGVLDGNNNECPICIVLSRPDDLSALEAYVLEEKRKVLEELDREFSEFPPDTKFFAESLANRFHRMTEELK